VARDAQQVMRLAPPQNALAASRRGHTIGIRDKAAPDLDCSDFRNRPRFRVAHPSATTRRAQLQREETQRLG